MKRRIFLHRLGGTAYVGAVTGLAGCSILGGNEPFTVIVDYDGQWSGSVGNEDGQQSVEGSGRREFEIEGDIVSAVAQKRDAGPGRLTVMISVDDNVVKGKYTTAQYGTVSVSHRRGGEDEVSGDVDLAQSATSTPPTQLGVENLEIEEVVSYVSTGAENGFVAEIQVYNPESQVVEGEVEAEFSVFVQDANRYEFFRITELMSVESDTTETYELILPEDRFGTYMNLEDYSPQGQGKATTCESMSEPQEYECDESDYSVTVSLVGQ